MKQVYLLYAFPNAHKYWKDAVLVGVFNYSAALLRSIFDNLERLHDDEDGEYDDIWKNREESRLMREYYFRHDLEALNNVLSCGYVEKRELNTVNF